MRVLIVSPGVRVTDFSLESFYRRAFTQLGCQAEIVCMMQPGRLAAIEDGLRRRVGRMIRTGLPPDMHGRRIVSTARDFRPDITIVVRGERLRAEAVGALEALSPRGCYNIYPDHPFTIPGPGAVRLREALGQYRAVFTFSRSLVPVFMQLGAKECKWLPFGYDPAVHRPVAGAKHGLAYFGAWGPIQQAWLEPLADRDLRIFGGGWERFKPHSLLGKCWRPGKGIGLQMAEEVANAALVVNLIRAEHGCAHSMKTFELPACCATVLVNRTTEQELFFREDEECVYFDSLEEMKDKARFLDRNEETRARIAEAALRAVQPHSYRSRADDLLRYAECGRWNMEGRYCNE